MPEPLPHCYPFRLVERTLERRGEGAGIVRAAVTANARRVEEGFLLASPLLAEMVAQAALLVEGGDPGLGRSGFLAGFSEFEVQRPPEAGDLLSVDVAVAARLGPVVRFQGTVTDQEGRPVARGFVTVRKGERPA